MHGDEEPLALPEDRTLSKPLCSPDGPGFEGSVRRSDGVAGGDLRHEEVQVVHAAEVAAALLGRPTAVRAVGRANGDNRIAIVVPCHRVVGADGSLTGYGGGLWRKRWLLEHERRTLAAGSS